MALSITILIVIIIVLVLLDLVHCRRRRRRRSPIKLASRINKCLNNAVSINPSRISCCSKRDATPTPMAHLVPQSTGGCRVALFASDMVLNY